jgi:hypothetical protein
MHHNIIRKKPHAKAFRSADSKRRRVALYAGIKKLANGKAIVAAHLLDPTTKPFDSGDAARQYLCLRVRFAKSPTEVKTIAGRFR